MTQTNIHDISSSSQPDADDNSALPFRMAPHNIEAEQALLGAILVNNEAHDRVSSFLEVDHFFEPLHGRIFQVASQLIHNNKPATPITLKTFFDHEEPVDENLTVPQYLGRLAAGATTIINAKEYGQTIYDLAQRRTLIIIGEDMVNTAYESTIDEPPSSQIEDAEQKLYKLAETGKYGQGFESFASALRGCIEMADAAYRRGGGLSGLATGLTALDTLMGGLQSSDLIVLAGRPSMGKTALATNIAFNIAKAHNQSQDDETADGACVGFYSLEMSSEQLATRIVSEQARVPSEDIRRGKLTDDNFRELVRVSQELQDIPFFIDPTGGISIAQLAARARRLKRQHNLGVIIVDYLQLLTGSGNSNANRVQEITEITTGLKALAKELAVPIVALSQLSRQVESRDDKRPMLSDLRESGSIEQDADVVLFVYREEYYLERSKPQEGTIEFDEWQRKATDACGKAEVIVAKQRHGPVGIVELQFTGEFTRFSDLAKNDHMPERTRY